MFTRCNNLTVKIFEKFEKNDSFLKINKLKSAQIYF
jgi:hypothetical protein